VRRTGAALIFAVVCTVSVMVFPATVASLVLFVPLVVLVAWVGWASMSREASAEDDRAALVRASRPDRVLRRVPESVLHPRVPSFPSVPRPVKVSPQYVLPPGASEVPGTVRGWLKSPPSRKV
jgi:hypothetical protein